jgi:hypothetical protein
MKKLLLTLISAMCLYTVANAQTFIQDHQKFFSGLKIEQSPQPNLIDLSAPQIDPSLYRGGHPTEFGNLEIAEELTRIMRYSALAKQSNIPRWDSLVNWAYQHLENGVLPVLLIDHHFNKLSDSFWLKQAYTYDTDSNCIKKVGPWNNSDFTQEDVFYFIPFFANIPFNVNSLILDQRFIISHREIESNVNIGIDINGHNHKLNINQPTPIQGIISGMNVCHLFLEADTNNARFNHNPGIQVMLGSNTKLRLVTKFQLYVTNLKPEWQTITEGLPIDQFEVKTFVSNENNAIVPTGAKVTIHYGNGPNGVNNCLKKPIVFVEGIDFGYKNRPTGCKDGKCGNMGYLDLLKGKQWNVETQSWSDWASIEFSPAILKQYRDSGYDIVYIDFYDGADYLQNNAVVTYHAIKEISNRLCGQHIHVVGASMGALVARRALTMIENDTVQHCIRSYTSFDGPLLGANIPIALQSALNYYSGVDGRIEDLKSRMLDRPASKQMLLVHYQNNDQPHELFNQFMADSSMQAFPSQPWKFAIINGSDQMEYQRADDLQLVFPGDSLIHFNIAQPLVNNVKRIANLLGGKALKIVASTLPTSDAKLFTYSRKSNALPNGKATVAIFKTTYAKAKLHVVNDQMLGLDHQAGGRSSATLDLFNSLQKKSWLVFSELYVGNTCFIPTWSAIGSSYAKKHHLQPLEYSIGKQPLNLKNTPFHDYYSQSTNQDHVLFEKSQNGNAIWLLKKIISTEKQQYDQTNKNTFIGNTFDKFLGSITVKSEQQLDINCNYTTSKMNPADINAVSQLKERVFILGNCHNAEIRIQKNATLNLGSGNSNHQNTLLQCKEKSKIIVEKGGTLNMFGGKSTLRIFKNAQLILEDGATLIIRDGSQLILDEGSKFVIGNQVNIYINGKNAIVHVKGELLLSQNATLQVRSEKGMETGMLKLSHVGGGFGTCKITGGGHAKLLVYGNDAQASTVLQIEGNINTHKVFDTIAMHRANVKFANNSSLLVSGYVQIENCGFSPTDWSKYSQNGLVVESGKLNLSGSEFSKLNTGLQIQSSCKAVVQNNRFLSCTTALLTESSGVKIKNCTFKNNTVGIEMFGNESLDSIMLSNFTSNETGIYSSAESVYNPLHVLESQFYQNTTGISTQKRPVALACCVFGYNAYGIKASETTVVAGAHSKIKANNDSLNCGNNTFAYSQKISIQLNGSSVFLDGNNNFLAKSSAKPEDKIQISGFLPTPKQSPNGTQSNSLNTGTNHWFPLDANDNSDSIQEKYLAVGTIDIGGRWYEINAISNQKSKLNTLCFDPYNSLDVTKRSKYNDPDGEENQTSLESETSLILKIPKEAKIYTIDGRMITENPFKSNWFDGLSEGFYFVHWTNENHESIARKVFIASKQ